MVYEGYASLGGNEIVNTERLRGFGLTYGCPMAWLSPGDACDTLNNALFEPTYDYSGGITSAPWYDPALPDLSSRFLGVLGIGISNLADSMRQASVTEGTDDGGTVGRMRDTVREPRYRCMLIADGADALDYGMSWLDAATRPGACGQHGVECGMTDFEFFADCPPARGAVPDFTAWTLSGTNLAKNTVTGKSMTNLRTYSTATIAATANAVRVTPGASDALARLFTDERIAVTVGDTITLSAEASAAITQNAIVTVYFYKADGSALTWKYSPVFSIGPSEFTRASVSMVVPANAATVSWRVETQTGQTLPAWMDVRRILVQNIAWANPFFDGDSTADNLNTYAWTGTANASTSTWSSRSQTSRPQTDDEYFQTVNTYRRYLHDVAVISGPTVTAEHKSGQFVAYEVEFVIAAERPWVYSVTRDVAIQPSTPIIVQDVVYNLAPYPSAELSSGTVVVATNYVTNPSVETDASGWVGGAAGSPAPAPAPTGARSTDIAANGVASYKVTTTTTNSGGGANAANIYSYRDTALGGGAGARYSVSVWAFLASTGAAANLGSISGTLEFRDSGGALVGSVDLGSVAASGGVISKTKILPPATAVSARTVIRGAVTSWSVGSILSLYTDAHALTVP